MAEGTIYKYYKSKDELLKAIGLDFITGIGEKIIVDNAKSIMNEMKDYSIEKKLKALILERLNIMNQYSSHLNVLMVEVRYDMDIRSIMLDNIVPKMFTMMNQVLNDAKEKGEIKNCDNSTLLRSFIGSVLMLFLQKKYIPNYNKDIDIETEVGMIIDLFMNGIKK